MVASGYLIPRELIQEISLTSFEEVDFPVPKDYDKYLTIVYGDYMKRPQESEQIGKHGVLGG